MMLMHHRMPVTEKVDFGSVITWLYCMQEELLLAVLWVERPLMYYITENFLDRFAEK